MKQILEIKRTKKDKCGFKETPNSNIVEWKPIGHRTLVWFEAALVVRPKWSFAQKKKGFKLINTHTHAHIRHLDKHNSKRTKKDNNNS